jgi:predicted nucleic acid-binding protein
MICIDASVAAKWLFPEEHSVEAVGLLQQALQEAEPIMAPSLLQIEVANIIRQQMRRGIVDLDSARALLAAFLQVPIAILAPRDLHDRALVVSNELNLPATYDAYYIALAEQYSAILWTADQRLLRSLRGTRPFVRDIAAWKRRSRSE